LQKGVNFGHRDKSTEMRNVPWLGLKQEKQVSVFLCLVVVGKHAFLHLGSIFEMARDFVLLPWIYCQLVGNANVVATRLE